MHVAFGRFEFGIAQIAPENTSHAEFVRLGKCFRDFPNLPG